MVAFPQRRGRGQSDGLYDEGFKPDRSSYSCQEDLTLGGAERAPGLNGHFLINDPQLWEVTMDDFLGQL